LDNNAQKWLSVVEFAKLDSCIIIIAGISINIEKIVIEDLQL
jgi:hypothetical protein